MSFCLVTGGAGFIGSHLVEGLLAQGHAVRVLDNFSTGSRANLAKVRNRIELLEGDVADLTTVRAACEEVELVFHYAGNPAVGYGFEDACTLHDAAVRGTLHVLQAAREALVRRVIHGASATVYAANAQPHREHDAVHPITCYAVAALASEQYCTTWGAFHGLDIVRLRTFNVFGPRQPAIGPHAGIIPLFLQAVLRRQRPVIHGDGLQCRDFTYVDDVVQANILAAEARRVSGRVYNVGSGRATTLLEVVECVNALLGTELRPIHTQPRPADLRHSQADLTRAQVDLGYCPCTDLERDLERCLESYAPPSKEPRRLDRPVCSLN